MKAFISHSIHRHRWIAALFIITILFATPRSASAHPLGNFTINHYSRLEPSANELRLRYVLDFAEIPTFQEKQIIDLDGDGAIGEAERTRYLSIKTDELRRNLRLKVGAAAIRFTLVPNTAELEFPPGQGGLSTMRLSAWFSAPLRLTNADRTTIRYSDENYAERIGWREIVIKRSDTVSLLEADAPERDTSDELRRYPEDLLSQPLNMREAVFTIAAGAGSSNESKSVKPLTTGAFGALDRTRDAFAALITAEELSPTVILVSLVAAVLLGALHSFSPGHGKAIVGAYLVGARGTARHALLLGLVVTATHTIGVYALGLVTLFASQYILPEQLYPWLGVISGVLVAVIGARLFWSRLALVRAGGNPLLHSHAHDHAHSHEHEHGTHTDHSHTHAGHESHEHDHESDHTHEIDHELEHARSHVPAVLTGSPLTMRNLVSLGVSGGLLPCPSALVVMLSAIALGRVAFGLVLIVAFSIGLAGVLTLTGLVLLYAGRLASRLMQGGRMNSLAFRAIPVASAFVVALLGIGIAAEAFMQTGLIK